MIQHLRERIALAVLTLTTSALAIVLTRLALGSISPERSRWLGVLHVLILAAVVVGSFVLLIRRKVSRVMWEGVFAIAAVIGVWYAALLSGLPIGIAILLAAVLTLTAILFRRIVIHDLFYLVGSAGFGIAAAAWLPWQVVVVGLVCFAAYDTVAAPEGGAIRHFAVKLSTAFVLPGMVIPMNGQRWLASIETVDPRHATMIGVGDLVFLSALASQFAISGFRNGMLFAAGVLGGGCIGIAASRQSSPRFVLVAIAASAALIVIGVSTIQLFVR